MQRLRFGLKAIACYMASILVGAPLGYVYLNLLGYLDGTVLLGPEIAFVSITQSFFTFVVVWLALMMFARQVLARLIIWCAVTPFVSTAIWLLLFLRDTSQWVDGTEIPAGEVPGAHITITLTLIAFGCATIACSLFFIWNDAKQQSECCEATSPLSNIRGRYLLVTSFSSLIVPIFFVASLWPQSMLVDQSAIPFDGSVGVVSYGLAAAFVLFAFRKKCGDYRIPLGPWPSVRSGWRFALLAIPLLGVSIASLYLVFYPLSYVWPDEVFLWVLQPIPIISWRPDIGMVIGSSLNVLAIVILAPVIEEVVFRGFLLNRWIYRFGKTRAIGFSSLIFGIPHLEVIGATLLGIVMCLIYLRTRSLIGPIIVHVVNNFAVVVWEVVDQFFGDGSQYTLADFHSEWWLGVVGGVIGLPWLFWYWRRHLAVN